MERLQQGRQFAWCQFAVPPTGDTGYRQRADPDPGKFRHLDAGTLHHAPHDAIHAFVHDDREQHTVGCFAHDPKLVRNNPLAIDLDTVADSAHDPFCRFLRRQDEVLLRQPVPRMHDPIRDVAVIREEQ